MKISKLLTVLCASALGVTALTARADDNATQAAARAALAQKVSQSGEQAYLPANATSNKAAAAPVTAKADKAAAEAKAKQEAADLKAKKAAEQKLAEKQAAEAKVAAKQAEAKDKAARAAAAAKAKPEAGPAAAQPQVMQADAKVQASQPATDQRVEAEKAALVAAMKQHPTAVTAQTNSPAKTPTPPVAKAKQAKKSKAAPTSASAPPANASDDNYAGKDLGMKPIAAPALPIAAGKEQRLQALLEKYKADKISPEEYHQQRAVILAEP